MHEIVFYLRSTCTNIFALSLDLSSNQLKMCCLGRVLDIIYMTIDNIVRCLQVIFCFIFFMFLWKYHITHYSKVNIIIINNELSSLFSAILADSFLLFSLMDRAKLCYVYLNKKPSLDFKKLDKLSTLEPKVPEIWIICILYVMCFNHTINSTLWPPSYPFWLRLEEFEVPKIPWAHQRLLQVKIKGEYVWYILRHLTE